MSVATLVELWYATQTTKTLTADNLARLRATLTSSPKVDLHVIDAEVVDVYTSIPRSVLTDPWDRLIVATADALALRLVTRESAICDANLVETIW